MHLFSSDTNTTDYNSLVAFKSQLMKQSNGASSTIFNSWNDTNHFCSWEGVTCGHKHHNKVMALDLRSSGLVGPLPPSIANFTFLKRLDLSLNWLNGEIHPNLARLQQLKYLNLSFNSFHGEIPPMLMTNNSVIQFIDLCCNQLTGKIPPFINSMSLLSHLDLSNNSIIGTIPSSLGNLSSLEIVRVYSNHIEGGIPKEIGRLHKLKNINLAENNLSGSIPSAFYNLSSLQTISLVSNHLYGDISTNIAQAFPYLEIFYIGGNNFFGSLHEALQNVTSIRRLAVDGNNFTGVVPPDLGKMHKLIYLNLQNNMLEADDPKDWRFLDSLTNCTSLEILALYSNNLGGMLPKSIGNLSIELQKMILGFNHISGSIPFEIGRYTKLNCIGMERNLLEGPIPESIGKLERLQDLTLFGNSLTGSIPYSLGNLTKLISLFLGFNQLTGPIPSSLKNLDILSALNLSHNNLTGLIPRELFLMHSILDTLDLSYNSFTGTLPLEVGHLEHLMLLDFSNNNLTGEISESLGGCQLLLQLNMENNFFHGSIPISIGNIKNLEILDLSHNNLSGVIPQSLQNIIFLKWLNLSFNNLEGEVPYKGVFTNFSVISLIGNEKICGGISKLHLPRCIARSSSSSKKNNLHLIKILVPILSILVLLLVLLMCYTLLHRKQKQNGQRKNSSNSSLSTQFPRISYTKLAKATNGFSTSYLVGHGRYESIYKGTLRDYEDIVAIKVFNLEVHGGFKSFIYECNALRGIRHRNIVRVLNSCSSIDHQGRDFKALIYEFMPKGNLDMWLHQQYETHEDNILSLEKRLNIIINVADALEYLHHSCEPSIIHCDIKPSNILLDMNMIAHVGDFGLSRMLSEVMSIPLQDYSQSEIKGTIGYIAPEYGEGVRPSTSADVYSFGIILLEMLTGRRPTDDIFNDNLNLYNHVKMAFPHRINNIIDCKMFTEEHKDAIMCSCQSINKCLFSWAEVGLSCSASLPEERPCIREVVTKLHSIRVTYLQSDGNKDFS